MAQERQPGEGESELDSQIKQAISDGISPLVKRTVDNSLKVSESVMSNISHGDWVALRKLFDETHPHGLPKKEQHDQAFFNAMTEIAYFGYARNAQTRGVPTSTPEQTRFVKAALELLAKGSSTNPSAPLKVLVNEEKDVHWIKTESNLMSTAAAPTIMTAVVNRMIEEFKPPLHFQEKAFKVIDQLIDAQNRTSNLYAFAYDQATLLSLLRNNRKADGSVVFNAEEAALAAPYFWRDAETFAEELSVTFANVLDEPFKVERMKTGLMRSALMVKIEPEMAKRLEAHCESVVGAVRLQEHPGILPVPWQTYASAARASDERAPDVATIANTMIGVSGNHVIRGLKTHQEGFLCPSIPAETLKDALALINPAVAEHARLDDHRVLLSNDDTKQVLRQISRCLDLLKDEGPEAAQRYLEQTRDAHPARTPRPKKVIAPVPAKSHAQRAPAAAGMANIISTQELEQFADRLLPIQAVHGLADRIATPDTKRGDKYMSSKGLHLIECATADEAEHVAAILKVLADDRSEQVQVAMDEEAISEQRRERHAANLPPLDPEPTGKHGLKFPVAVGYDAARAIAENVSLITRTDTGSFHKDRAAAETALEQGLSDIQELDLPQESVAALVASQREGRRRV